MAFDDTLWSGRSSRMTTSGPSLVRGALVLANRPFQADAGRMREGLFDDPRSGRPAASRWIDGWLEACSDLAELERSNPMTDAVIDEIDGRMIRIGDKWLADFASCNYLGFDLEREIIDSVGEYLERWGTHPSWSRLLGSPVLYEQIEERLTELVGAEDTLVLPTITLIHMSVIPVLAGG